jgi:hypothetical protein
MLINYPNPWSFDNKDKELISPDNFHKIMYFNLNEISMGAPLGGNCVIEVNQNQKVKINHWCSGPPVWETSGKLLAIPIFNKKIFRGTIQQIGVININTFELKIYSKIFNVLDLRSFHEGNIYGYDSPNHNTKTINFDLGLEKIDKVVKLIK